MRHYGFLYMLLCGVALLTTGCRKELVYEPEEVVPGYRMALDIDWALEWELGGNGLNWSNNWDLYGFDEGYDFYRPQLPEGFGIMLYDQNESNYTYSREMHLSTRGDSKITVDETTRALLLYSDDSEYINVSDISAPHTAYASTYTRTRSSFTKLHSEERTVSPPDILFGAYLEIDDLQQREGYQNYKVNFRPLVYGYVIRFAIDTNRKYISQARGALAGMAEGIYLKDGRTSDTAVTMLFDCDLKSYGVGTQVMTFGIPGHSLDKETNTVDDSRRYDANLEILLKNGKVLNYNFDITDQVKRQPRGGVILLSDIEIPDEEAKEPNSGFIPKVSDWGDIINIDL